MQILSQLASQPVGKFLASTGDPALSIVARLDSARLGSLTPYTGTCMSKVWSTMSYQRTPSGRAYAMGVGGCEEVGGAKHGRYLSLRCPPPPPPDLGAGRISYPHAARGGRGFLYGCSVAFPISRAGGQAKSTRPPSQSAARCGAVRCPAA
ncbi:hypothetical protein BS50DRAFT_315335 [Corynespora cassiicola Philippines]|uniref:Uncharacterized protein n=1 Tax=Corynespora cassiicola Philippines TaxID=1448308 RepID=A0A2T2NYI8_CORCC|nr:hypothetical protein BS50DRAFT_315335 [Corynespora cassiicola Philippines]